MPAVPSQTAALQSHTLHPWCQFEMLCLLMLDRGDKLCLENVYLTAAVSTAPAKSHNFFSDSDKHVFKDQSHILHLKQSFQINACHVIKTDFCVNRRTHSHIPHTAPCGTPQEGGAAPCSAWPGIPAPPPPNHQLWTLTAPAHYKQIKTMAGGA